VSGASSQHLPNVCVSAVLGDALHRVAVMGGREGMSRSLGSVLGGSVTRFLGGSLRGVVSRVINTPGVQSDGNGVAVTVDGSTLLVSDYGGGSHSIREYSIADGLQLRVVGAGTHGSGDLEFFRPRQVWVASDGFVFVADFMNHRVQVLTPTLDFHTSLCEPRLAGPVGVCANADVIVVAEYAEDRVTVLRRCDGAPLRRFGSKGGGDGQLDRPSGVCFVSDDRHVAVTEVVQSRVSVFRVDGDFIRHVGVDVLRFPAGVACSAFDELVVADRGNTRVVLFSSSGDVLATLGSAPFSGVVLSGGLIFAQDSTSGRDRCVVFE
jgi:tripartite motif-containing protein 2/3